MKYDETLAVLIKASNQARGLALDAIAKCKSGHLGLPLGCAEIGAALFGECLTYNPEDPNWANRDRLILSAGHGSMFLYSWLHISGYNVSLNDIANFRQKGSITPGHPEFGLTSGVECTTGPLGQGIANAVGIALSNKITAERYNQPDNEIFTNKVICLCGDGCLQEGISSEACSLAGHWKLDNLVIIYDSNDVTLDSDLNKTQSDDVEKRFSSYGFEVFSVDGHDIRAICDVINIAKNSNNGHPKIIIAKTEIGHGINEVAGTHKAHGEGGAKFIDSAKRTLGLPDVDFYISDDVKEFFAKRKQQLIAKYNDWQYRFSNICEKHPELSTKQEFDLKTFLNTCDTFDKDISTRAAFGKVLNVYAMYNNRHLTGSADLFGSTKNYLEGLGDISADNYLGRNIYFGIREHAMGAIANGILYDGSYDISIATFLSFSEYLRPAIRLAALSHLPVKYIFTHDSVAVGEDGPTHQPIETVASLRCIPNLDIVRPADGEECIGAMALSVMNNNRPTAIILSRQDLPLLTNYSNRENLLLGGYIALHESAKLKYIIMSCGSELHLAIEVASERNDTRVVSMPCMECFERQTDEYRDNVLPKSCTKRIAIEAGISTPWQKYIGNDGKVISIETFGFSARGNELMEHFGITSDNLRTVLSKL